MSILDHPKVREAMERTRDQIAFALNMGWAPEEDPLKIEIKIHGPADVSVELTFAASKLLDEKETAK